MHHRRKRLFAGSRLGTLRRALWQDPHPHFDRFKQDCPKKDHAQFFDAWVALACVRVTEIAIEHADDVLRWNVVRMIRLVRRLSGEVIDQVWAGFDRSLEALAEQMEDAAPAVAFVVTPNESREVAFEVYQGLKREALEANDQVPAEVEERIGFWLISFHCGLDLLIVFYCFQSSAPSYRVAVTSCATRGVALGTLPAKPGDLY